MKYKQISIIHFINKTGIYLTLILGVEMSQSEPKPARGRARLVYIYKARAWTRASFEPHILSSSPTRKIFHKLKLD